MNDTPRTNAVAGYPDGSGCWKYTDLGLYVDADFARGLERENSRMRALLEQVLDGSVDARTYPDGPCLDRELRKEIKATLANIGSQP